MKEGKGLERGKEDMCWKKKKKKKKKKKEKKRVLDVTEGLKEEYKKRGRLLRRKRN